MNLFFLHIDPEICAKYHCDKHVIKMLLEIVQMLYTAFYVNGPVELLNDNCYKKIKNHKHPTAIWIRLCKENWDYAYNLAFFLSKEYTLRYSKIHSCDKHLEFFKNNLPNFKNEDYKKETTLSYNIHFQNLNMTPIPLTMPNELKISNETIFSYRNYYIKSKRSFATWKTKIPYWFVFYTIRDFFKK